MMTPAKTALASLGLLCGLGFLVTACPAVLDDECAEGACGPRGSAGEGGSDVLVDTGTDAPIPVDPCVNTPSDPKCLDESTALFVSSKANVAGADGSRAHPFKSIGAGLAAVTAARKRVYVCEGDYLENVNIKTAVSLLGGLTCDWMSKGSNPRVAPAKGVALSIVKSNGAVVTDVNVEGSADPLVDGDSAIGVFVSESQGVLLRRVTVKAGTGSKGAGGADGIATPNYGSALAPSGLNTGTTAAAEAPSCLACADGTLSGGGKGAPSGGAAAPGTAMPAVGADNSGGTVGGACVAGSVGASGLAGAAAGGAAAPGSVNASGWQSPTAAKKGPNGNPGQGGGGAGSTASVGGGSGGCGGCGGSGGGPGGNGGSSFAVLTFGSDVAVEDSSLTSGTGGIGGKGGNGQDGQLKGGPGNGACLAGAGGNGAGGGGGGGGAGGHSAAIAHSGKAPSVTMTSLLHGTAGDIGSGGTQGAAAGAPGNAGNLGESGAKGTAGDILNLQ